VAAVRGRRVINVEALERAGDYTGPHPVEYPDGRRRAMWFLLPTHEGKTAFDRPTPGSTW
jgi:hypothetical protein